MDQITNVLNTIASSGSNKRKLNSVRQPASKRRAFSREPSPHDQKSTSESKIRPGPFMDTQKSTRSTTRLRAIKSQANTEKRTSRNKEDQYDLPDDEQPEAPVHATATEARDVPKPARTAASNTTTQRTRSTRSHSDGKVQVPKEMVVAKKTRRKGKKQGVVTKRQKAQSETNMPEEGVVVQSDDEFHDAPEKATELVEAAEDDGESRPLDSSQHTSVDSVAEGERDAAHDSEIECSATERENTSLLAKAPSWEEREAMKMRAAEKRKKNADLARSREEAAGKLRANKFLQDIRQIVEDDNLGGMSRWNVVGDGVLKIATLTHGKPADTNRSMRSISRRLQSLENLFELTDDPDDEGIALKLGELRQKSHPSSLNGIEKGESLEDARNYLYKYLIPKTVSVIKRHLRNRFVSDERSSWEELLILATTTINMCDYAKKLTSQKYPIYSSEVSGTTLAIRSAMDNIRNAIIKHINQLADREKRARLKALRIDECIPLSQVTVRRPLHEMEGTRLAHPAAEVVDVDELEDAGLQQNQIHDQSEGFVDDATNSELGQPPSDWDTEEEIVLHEALHDHLVGEISEDAMKQRWNSSLPFKSVDQCRARVKYSKRWYEKNRNKVNNPAYDWFLKIQW